MATIWDLIKASLNKRRQGAIEAERSKNPLDRDLPFGLHIDGKIEVHAPLPENLSAAFPQGAHIVSHFSKTIILDQTCFRVLLTPEAGDLASYLWIIQGEAESSVRWFVKLDEVFPASQEEWNFWIGDEDGYIGLPTFETKSGTLFQRLWGGKESARVKPVNYQEEIHLERYDAAKTLSVKHSSMLYGRQVEDPTCPCDEYLLLSATEERDGSCVSIDVGVDLNAKINIVVVY